MHCDSGEKPHSPDVVRVELGGLLKPQLCVLQCTTEKAILNATVTYRRELLRSQQATFISAASARVGQEACMSGNDPARDSIRIRASKPVVP
jgi:hypothetical protein